MLPFNTASLQEKCLPARRSFHILPPLSPPPNLPLPPVPYSDRAAEARFQGFKARDYLPPHHKYLSPNLQVQIPDPLTVEEVLRRESEPSIQVEGPGTLVSFLPKTLLGVRCIIFPSQSLIDELEASGRKVGRGTPMTFRGIDGGPNGFNYVFNRVRSVEDKFSDIEFVATNHIGCFALEGSSCWPPIALRLPTASIHPIYCLRDSSRASQETLRPPEQHNPQSIQQAKSSPNLRLLSIGSSLVKSLSLSPRKGGSKF